MKTIYTLENIEDYRHAVSSIRATGDNLPILKNRRLEVTARNAAKETRVVLVTDEPFIFEMNWKEFIIEVCEEAGMHLVGRDAIPT